MGTLFNSKTKFLNNNQTDAKYMDAFIIIANTTVLNSWTINRINICQAMMPYFYVSSPNRKKLNNN